MAERAIPRYPVYLVRHGATDLNLQQRFQGRSDAPLNETGRLQAEKLGAKLRDLLPRSERSLISLHCSPLLRAVQSMETIAVTLGRGVKDISLADDLIEMGFGNWEGLTTLEVKEKFPDERRARKKDRWSYTPRGGESYASAAGRLRNWISAQNAPALAVTHLGVMRAAAVIAGGHDPEIALQLDPGHEAVWLFGPQGLERL